jgi:hypothetical protein
MHAAETYLATVGLTQKLYDQDTETKLPCTDITHNIFATNPSRQQLLEPDHELYSWMHCHHHREGPVPLTDETQVSLHQPTSE